MIKHYKKIPYLNHPDRFEIVFRLPALNCIAPGEYWDEDRLCCTLNVDGKVFPYLFTDAEYKELVEDMKAAEICKDNPRITISGALDKSLLPGGLRYIDKDAHTKEVNDKHYRNIANTHNPDTVTRHHWSCEMDCYVDINGNPVP